MFCTISLILFFPHLLENYPISLERKKFSRQDFWFLPLYISSSVGHIRQGGYGFFFQYTVFTLQQPTEFQKRMWENLSHTKNQERTMAHIIPLRPLLRFLPHSSVVFCGNR